ncbi:Titin [Manis pentadactyla]|nr:Titin [Manis pentadactyla]
MGNSTNRSISHLVKTEPVTTARYPGGNVPSSGACSCWFNVATHEPASAEVLGLGQDCISFIPISHSGLSVPPTH